MIGCCHSGVDTQHNRQLACVGILPIHHNMTRKVRGMDEFGESRSIYVWPEGHEDGDPFPEDFWKRVDEGLKSVGIEWETV